MPFLEINFNTKNVKKVKSADFKIHFQKIWLPDFFLRLKFCHEKKLPKRDNKLFLKKKCKYLWKFPPGCEKLDQKSQKPGGKTWF